MSEIYGRFVRDWLLTSIITVVLIGIVRCSSYLSTNLSDKPSLSSKVELIHRWFHHQLQGYFTAFWRPLLASISPPKPLSCLKQGSGRGWAPIREPSRSISDGSALGQSDFGWHFATIWTKIYDLIQTKKANNTFLFSERIVSFAFIGIFSDKVICFADLIESPWKWILQLLSCTSTQTTDNYRVYLPFALSIRDSSTVRWPVVSALHTVWL
jgi:hypothetical protein